MSREEMTTVSLSWPDALNQTTRPDPDHELRDSGCLSGSRATVMFSSFRCRSIPSRQTCRSPFPPDELMPKVPNSRPTLSKSTTCPGTIGPHEIVRYRVDDTHHGEIVGKSTGHGDTATIQSGLAAPAVELIEIRPIRR